MLSSYIIVLTHYLIIIFISYLKFNNSHKAFVITLLLTGTLLLSIFNLSVYELNSEVAELTIPIEIIEEELKEENKPTLNNNSKQTNKGFNETKKYKHFAQAYKPIAPPKDYDYSKFNARNDKPTETKTAEKNTANSNIKREELTAFNSVNSLLNKQSNTKTSVTAKASANLNSTVTYSLKGRTDEYLPPPVYLCQANGKIIVNITVNNNGKVIEAYVNNASTSTNACLRERAIEYAKKARFDAASKASQIGSITFNFKGK